MVKTACKILGFVLIAAGIVGFFKHDLAGFHLTTIHNIVHLVTGGVALYFGFATTVAAARMFCLILGAIYLLLGIVGFVAPALVAAIIQAHGDDVNLLAANIVHFFDGRPAVGVIRVRVQVAAQIGVSRGFSGREIRTKMKRSC